MKNLPWILVGVLALALMLSWSDRGAGRSEKGGGDTIYLPARVDTIRDTLILPPVSEKPAGKDTARLPVLKPVSRKPYSKPEPKPTSDAERMDSITSDTAGQKKIQHTDSVDVLIPIVEREYRTPDYRIVVSGYNTQLREVEMYRRTETKIVNHRPRRKRWGLGPSLSWGIGPDGKAQFVLGISVHYNLLQW